MIVGATFVGFETAELLHAATIAVTGEATARARSHTRCPSFPTRSEVWLKLFDKSASEPRPHGPDRPCGGL